MDCERIRDAMAAYVYDEATDGERVAVEAHVATCAACRARLDDDRETLRRLDGWTMPTIDAPTLAPRRQAPNRWRAPLVGATAAAAAFAALAWIGTHAEWRDGRFSITFGRGSAAPAIAEEIRGAGLRPLVEVVTQQVDGRMRSLARAFDAVLLEEEERREERLLALVATLERQQARTARLLVNRIDRLGLEDRLLLRDPPRRDPEDAALDDAAQEWERLADDPNETPKRNPNRKDPIR